MRHPIPTALLALAGLCLASTGGHASDRIIGGHQAAQGAWNFTAYVLIEGSYQCGGTLVAPNIVLTAGHCGEDPATKTVHAAASFLVRVGSIDANSGGELHHVKRVVVHGDFGKAYPLENDIALLELDTASKYAPVRLDGLAAGAGRLAIEGKANPFAKILGWGRTNPDPKQQSLSNLLREASLPIVANPTCQATLSGPLKQFGPIDARRLCAGLGQGGVDTCNGDSGGPILAQGADQQWVQVGIVSYGDDICGREGAYGVYTRVSAFGGWLAGHLPRKDGPPTPPAPPVPPSPITSAETIIAAAERNDGQVRIDILSEDLKPQKQFPTGVGLKVRVTSVFEGSLLLLNVGEDGAITQLFPNQYSAGAYPHGRLKAGGSVTLPDPTYGFALTTSLDDGHVQERDRIIAVVAENGAAFDGIVKALGESDGGARDSLARLEVVLKHPGTGGVNPGRWAASLSDYIVNK